jgi:hypothetical protein
VLLSRREIRVLWADSFRDARASLRQHRPAVLVTRPKLADGDAIRLFTQFDGPDEPHRLVLLKRQEWEQRARFLEAGASDVLDASDGVRLLEEIGRVTGIRFARHRRVQFEAPGEAKIIGGGRSYPVMSQDISATGIGLKGVSAQTLDALVKLTLLVDGRPRTFWGRVTRSWSDGDAQMVGLRFIAMNEEERLELSALIESRTSFAPPAHEVFSTLFDDVETPKEPAIALTTGDLLVRPGSESPPPRRPVSVPVEPTLSQPVARLTAQARTVRAEGDGSVIRESARAALKELGTIGTELSEEGLAELVEVRAALLREYMSRE